MALATLSEEQLEALLKKLKKGGSGSADEMEKAAAAKFGDK